MIGAAATSMTRRTYVRRQRRSLTQACRHRRLFWKGPSDLQPPPFDARKPRFLCAQTLEEQTIGMLCGHGDRQIFALDQNRNRTKLIDWPLELERFPAIPASTEKTAAGFCKTR